MTVTDLLRVLPKTKPNAANDLLYELVNRGYGGAILEALYIFRDSTPPSDKPAPQPQGGLDAS